ncbi:MAG TPA: ferredoxin-type protein NapF [Rhodocyclaceae bacterium]|nr:MAG: ferredoxin-type protein NapF [Betaproteobacteria bacterium CG2_30_68_42]PIX75516.1 MAG: ferredoxin-type protein NapF [Rhodocyclales bacterium CG_4_10_14_3_um_filter_68_10]PJA56501.1 MAG: ferredoxin-type protein NapF [Rhodocyclales bacterium CG_4_9_14_3_um_filter_68_10]HCX33110.1 ferredoxin-type protein NapF [Rhodocyclaceae bacterium]
MGVTRAEFMRGRARRPRPPWALAEREFIGRCTRCGECSSSCPAGILVRGAGGYPEVDFTHGGCTFCAACVRICATGALRWIEAAPAWNLRAVICATRCLASRAVVCRGCGDACEADAISFRPGPAGIGFPAVDWFACTGCGACVPVCPVQAVTAAERRREAA